MRSSMIAVIACMTLMTAHATAAQQTPAAPVRRVIPAPNRPAGEGDGPHQRLIVRGATLIDGTGAPPYGPVDIVIEGNRIAAIRGVGAPGLPIDPRRRPGDATKEIDAHGMYVLPGFVDLHAHSGGMSQLGPTSAEYVYKLWLAHGVTTVRDPGSDNGVDWTLDSRTRSSANQITAPRVFSYVRPGAGWTNGAITTPAKAREYVQWAAKKGVDGFKLGSHDPEIMAALLDEAKKHGLGSQAHLNQLGVARMNVLDAARLGLGSMEHWYGLPEALFDGRTVQDYPTDYNYNDEYHRFGQAGRLWKQAAAPYSDKWNAVMKELLDLQFVLDPTMTIYEASRDVMRAKNADWHQRYTLPTLWQFYQPSRESHGSYWFDWTTADEIEWKNNYRLWMTFLNEYKNRGGKVCTGSDSGFIYKVYGFDYIRELELLQEAGFHPLEVIRAATLCGAETLMKPKGRSPDFGIVRVGNLADLVIVPENPLHNLKVLYGTGTVRLDSAGKPVTVGGIKYTIKDGIVYDAKRLLEDVARMVEEQKAKPAVTSSR
jgi:imidazolonepropionase-like amidohydrolase